MTDRILLTLLAVIAAGLAPGLVILLARRHLPGSRADAALLAYLRQPAIAAIVAVWSLGLLAIAFALRP